MGEDLLAQGTEGAVSLPRRCKAQLSLTVMQSHLEFSGLLSLQKFGGQRKGGQDSACISWCCPEGGCSGSDIEKLGVERENWGLGLGVEAEGTLLSMYLQSPSPHLYPIMPSTPGTSQCLWNTI